MIIEIIYLAKYSIINNYQKLKFYTYRIETVNRYLVFLPYTIIIFTINSNNCLY